MERKMEGKNPREKYFSRKDENVIFEKYVLVFIDVDRNLMLVQFTFIDVF